MDFASLQTVLITAVQTSLADNAYDVIWNQRETGWRDPSHVKLTMMANPSRGRDEIRTTPEGDDDIRERIYGIRNPIVQVTCEAQDQDLAEGAWQIANTIVTRFRGNDIVDILSLSDVGVARIGDMVKSDYMDMHGDWRSAVTFELFLNTHTSLTGALIPYIKAIEFSGTTDGPSVGPTTVSEP